MQSADNVLVPLSEVTQFISSKTRFWLYYYNLSFMQPNARLVSASSERADSPLSEIFTFIFLLFS
jgi:hypothetical protein